MTQYAIRMHQSCTLMAQLRNAIAERMIAMAKEVDSKCIDLASSFFVGIAES